MGRRPDEIGSATVRNALGLYLLFNIQNTIATMLIMYWSRNESIAHCEHDGIFILKLALKVVVRVKQSCARPGITTQYTHWHSVAGFAIMGHPGPVLESDISACITRSIFFFLFSLAGD
jgi:hypothetical protein